MFLTPFTADAEDEATQKFVSDFEAAFRELRISLQRMLMTAYM